MEQAKRLGDRVRVVLVVQLFVAAGVLSAVFMGRVAINYR